MLEWLLKTLGISQSLTGRLDEVQLMWARPTVLLVGLILLLPIAFFIVVRHRNSLPHVSRSVRGVLSACRIGILLLLVIVLGGPFLRLDEHISDKPLVFWLLDESDSMSLPVGAYSEEQSAALAQAAGMVEKPSDGTAAKIDANVRRELFNLSRAELTGRVLENSKSLKDRLEEQFELQPYRFARTLAPGVWGNMKQSKESDSADRKDTNLGGVLEEVITQSAGRKLAGIVVLTDGRSTIGPDVSDVIRRHQAVTTDEAGVPVWTVPLGSPEPLVDITLLDVLCPAQVTLKDTAALVATVNSSGFDNRRVKVRLLEKENVLDEAELTLRDLERRQVQLKFEAKEPGIHLLTVEVERQGEEQVHVNNRLSVTIDVDEQRWKVLYLEGYPRWDFRFLDHSFRRDQGLEVTIVVEASLRAEASKEQELPKLARLPENAEGFSKYNVVMLGDITPRLLPEALQRELALAVERDGVGLIVQAGPQAMPHAFADGPLAGLLPVKFATGKVESSAKSDGIEAPAFAPFQMTVTSQGSIHPAFRLYDSATRNRSVWSRMPSFFWAAAADDTTPGATVLAELTTVAQPNRPLIAEQFVGAGRVVFIGTDATYRWRAYIGDHLFSRFWGQVIRHVARSGERGGKDSWLEVYPVRVEVGESVSVELYALDAGGQPLEQSQMSVRLVQGETVQTVILKQSTQAGHFHGSWMASEEGQYTFGSEIGGRSVSASVQVVDSSRELMRPDVDRDTLGNLAELSKGGLLELNEIEKLSEKLKGETLTINRVHEEEIWDNWLTLVLLVMLYCLDVFVRRMSGLT
ncbi:MAG: hypothetical protein KAY65_07645 [Planctomycetes bacterium]|nr:hypothetical protein [Planctomycetota bacterium]